MPQDSATPSQRTFFVNDGVPYAHFMKKVRDHFEVGSYFEIGTYAGGSLTFVDCPTVAVDPNFRLENEVVGKKPAMLFFQMGSDQFFESYDLEALLRGPVDMAFLDGMHVYEYLLRDFINVERYMKNNGVVFLHDCLPGDFRITTRRQSEAFGQGWTGDVWKVVPILRRYRPDLQIHLFNCPPTGLVMITNLDRTSSILKDNYYSITQEFAESEDDLAKFESFFQGSEHLDSKDYRDFSEISKLIWL